MKIIKSNWQYICLGLLVVSLFVHYNQCQKSNSFKQTINVLNATNSEIDLQLNEKLQQEETLLREIELKKDAIKDKDKLLNKKLKEISTLEGKIVILKKRPEFKKLDECNKEYTGLFKSYTNILNLNNINSKALHLCIEQKAEFKAIVQLLENKYSNCQTRHGLKDRKIDSYRFALTDLEKKFKRKLFKTKVKFTVGVALTTYIAIKLIEGRAK